MERKRERKQIPLASIYGALEGLATAMEFLEPLVSQFPELKDIVAHIHQADFALGDLHPEIYIDEKAHSISSESEREESVLKQSKKLIRYVKERDQV